VLLPVLARTLACQACQHIQRPSSTTLRTQKACALTHVCVAVCPGLFVCCGPHRHLVTAYGEGWRVPDLSYHGFTKHPADFRSVERALLARLAVTAWGNVTGAEREARCNARKKQSTAPPQTKQSSAPPPPPSPPGLAVKQGSQQNDQKKLAASRPDGAMRGRRLVSATQPSMS
jgi:hypothetical protein